MVVCVCACVCVCVCVCACVCVVGEVICAGDVLGHGEIHIRQFRPIHKPDSAFQTHQLSLLERSSKHGQCLHM